MITFQWFQAFYSLQSLGFVGAKIPCPYGPSEGDEGLKKTMEFFKEARASVGDDFPLM